MAHTFESSIKSLLIIYLFKIFAALLCGKTTFSTDDSQQMDWIHRKLINEIKVSMSFVVGNGMQSVPIKVDFDGKISKL